MKTRSAAALLFLCSLFLVPVLPAAGIRRHAMGFPETADEPAFVMEADGP